MARTPKVVEDRREQIIEAALHVFAEKGFDRATNKDIANVAQITPGLIYHYFASKEALLHAIIDQGSPVQSIRTIPPTMATQPPEIMIRFLIRQMLNFAESEQFMRLVRIFLPELLHNQKFSSSSLFAFQEGAEFIQHYLAEKMETGVLRQGDFALIAQTMMSTVTGFVLRRQVFRDPLVLVYSIDQIADSIVSVTLHGLLP